MTVTIKDVAKSAGVSISTVSRVINDSKPVSPEARRKVLKAIEESGYQPNELARSLVTRKSNLIGVIANDIGSTYSAQIIKGIEEVGRMYKYDILLSCSYGSAEQECRLANLLKQKQVEGMIVISEIENEDLLKFLKTMSIPYIYLNHDYVVKDVASVLVNSFDASKELTQYLIDCGHSNILYLHKKGDESGSLDELKINAYKEALEANGIKKVHLFSENQMITEKSFFDSRIVDYIKTNKISAIITSTDKVGVKLIKYLEENKIKVPGDISVVGYGNEEIASLFRPSLTSMDFPYYDIGAVSVRRVLKSIEANTSDDNLFLLPFRVVPRDSVKFVK